MIKKIGFAAVGLALLTAPLLASADTLSDLQAQVQALMAQINALQGQTTQQITPPSGQPDDYGTSTPNTGVYCPKLSITMQRGSRDATTGGQVSELQAFLTDYYNLPDGLINGGFFGKLTEKYLIQFQNEQGLPAFGIAGVLTRAKIASVCGGGTTPQPTSGITVTAPNGGEQWEEGILNTVTWTPYNYNPDINPSKDVTAYLETKNTDGSFTILGKVEEGGKASIHWVTGQLNSNSGPASTALPGGGYYIRVVNNVTGAWDRSDAPFTLVSRAVDLKVNGSNGPVTLTDNQPITVTLILGGTAPMNSCALYGVRSSSGGSYSGLPVPISGSVNTYSLFAFAPAGGGGTAASAVCQRADGGQSEDGVIVNLLPSTIATVKITSPNGGEQISLDQPYIVKWSESGIKSVSVALYKNDQWLKWIVKDMLTTSGAYNDQVQVWPEWKDQPTGQNIFKIYITGQKADGSGYVDDKSDAPFSFVGGIDAGKFPISADKTSYAPGETVTIYWGSHDGASTKDWIALVPTGVVYTSASWAGGTIAPWVYTNASVGGPVAIKAPSALGTYDIVFYLNNGFTEAARHPAALTVGSSSGALTVSTDASSPSYQVVTGGSTGVTLGVLKFHAIGEGVRIDKIGLQLGGTAYPGDLTRASLYVGDLLVGNALFVGNNTTAISTLTQPVSVPPGADLQITIKGDIAAIGTSQPGRSGDLIKVGTSPDIRGTGLSSGSTILVSSGVGPDAFPGVRIFRSYPTVAQGLLPSTGMEDGRLLHFSVTANSSGNIGISQFPFTISTAGGISVANLGLYGFTDSSYSSPISGQGTGGLIGSGVTPSAPLNTRFFMSPLGSTPVEIPAGQTYYFELRGAISGISTGSSVVTSLLGDSTYSGLFAGGSSGNGNFQWSPNDMTTSQFSDTDWTNGYGIPGLSTSGIIQTRTGSGGTTPTCPPIPQVLCQVGYSQVSGGTDSNGCQLANKCVAPTLTSSVTTSASNYPLGVPITVSWTNTGTTYAHDWIGLVMKGGAWGSVPNAGQNVTWTYTNGDKTGTKTLTAPTTAGGTYEVIYNVNDAVKELMRSAPFTVVAPPSSLTTDAPMYVYGAPITITWSSGVTTYPRDWIAVVTKSGAWGSVANGGQGVTWTYTNGDKTGTKTLNAPSAPGTYEIIYNLNDTQREMIRSSSFTVVAPPTSLTTDAPGYAPGAPITITWSNGGTTYAHDWIGIVTQGGVWGSATNGGQNVTWTYTNGANTGTKTLTAPSAPGTYEILYNVNDTQQNLMRSASFTVSGSGTVTPPPPPPPPSPTFATLKLDTGSSAYLSQGNLRWTFGGSNSAVSSPSMFDAGNRTVRFSMKFVSGTASGFTGGVEQASAVNGGQNVSNVCSYRFFNGTLYCNGVGGQTQTGSVGMNAGDVLDVVVDHGLLYFYKNGAKLTGNYTNGSWNASALSGSYAAYGDRDAQASATVDYNFGQQPWGYSIPAYDSNAYELTANGTGASAADRNVNLASALSALESALQALLKILGQ